MKRKYGSGTLEFKQGRYFWRESGPLRRRHDLLTSDRKEALKRIPLFTVESIAQLKNSVRLSDAWDIFENSPRRPLCSERFLKEKKRVWIRFYSFFELKHAFLHDFSADDLCLWRKSILAGGCCPKTANDYISVVRQIFSFFKMNEIFSDIVQLPHISVHRDYFTAEQLKRVFDTVDGNSSPSIPCRDEMKILFRLGAYTGLRLKDCCLFKWENVDLNRGFINCVPFKTRHSSGNSVWVPLHPDLKIQLEVVKKNFVPGNYVLPNIAAQYLRAVTNISVPIQKTMNWAVWDVPLEEKLNRKAPKVGRYGFHSFRHSFASFCANAGIPLAWVQSILGQSSQIVTRFYVHLELEAYRAVLSALPSFSSKP